VRGYPARAAARSARPVRPLATLREGGWPARSDGMPLSRWPPAPIAGKQLGRGDDITRFPGRRLETASRGPGAAQRQGHR